MLDGAFFASLSDRRRSFGGIAVEPSNYRAVIVGIGFRQVRDQPTQAPIRLDIGRAVWRSRKTAQPLDRDALDRSVDQCGAYA